MSFPGGKRDPQDTSNIVVALREAYEETALNPFDVQLLGDLPMQKARNGMLVKPVVGSDSSLKSNLVAQPTEIDRIFFASLKQSDGSAPPMCLMKFVLPINLSIFPVCGWKMKLFGGLTARMLVIIISIWFGLP